MRKQFCIIIAVICMLALVSGVSWADQKMVTTTDVSGAWNYRGTGTINGYLATDVGTLTVSTSGAVGSQTITNISVSGTITNNSIGQSQPYSYSTSGSAPYDGSFSTIYNGITVTFTETSSTTATLAEKGTTTDTGDVINLTYQATKGSSSGDSGGGCSVGFVPMSLLLLLPLGILLKK